MEERRLITPNARIEFAITNLTSEAGEALIAEGQFLAYSAHGTVSDVSLWNKNDQSNGLYEKGISRSEVSINGKAPVVRQVDAGENKVFDVGWLSTHGHQDLQILDGEGNLVRSKTIDVSVRNGSDTAKASILLKDKDAHLIAKTEESCTLPGNGDVLHCQGTKYDSHGHRIASYKTSDYTSSDGRYETGDYVYFDRDGYYLGTVHSEVEKFPLERRATVDITIVNSKDSHYQPVR